MSKKSVNLIPSLTDKDGNSVKDSSKMAGMFHDFFTNISAKINDSIPHTKMSPLDYLTNRNDKSFFISPTTPEEVEAIIVSLNSEKSTGPYSIPVKGGGGGGGSIRIEPSRQHLDCCTHKRNSKRKEGKPVYH